MSLLVVKNPRDGGTLMHVPIKVPVLTLHLYELYLY